MIETSLDAAHGLAQVCDDRRDGVPQNIGALSQIDACARGAWACLIKRPPASGSHIFMPNDDDDVGRFDRDDNENSPPTSQSSMFRLATAQLSAHENCPSSKFHLRFTLGCGTGNLVGAENQYEINLRQCVVDLVTEGCNADLTDAYSFQLPDVDIAESSSFESLEQRAVGGEIRASAEAKHGFVNRITVGIASKASAAKEATQHEVRTTKRKRRVMLIACNGDHWVVGDDEHGDPRNEQGWLRERYFNEDKTKPLCAINVRKGTEKATVTISVRAKLGHLDVSLLDSMGRPTRRAGPQHMPDVATALRERLKGLAVAKALRERQSQLYPALPPAEFELVRTTIVAHMPKQPSGADLSQVVRPQLTPPIETKAKARR
jgi:hypothetical protein